MRAKGERVAAGMWWDQAWSLVEGCRHVSPGCANCWAAGATAMRARQSGRVGARYAGLTDDNGKFNGTCRFMDGDLQKPLYKVKGQLWAVWNDLFFDSLSEERIAAAFGVMLATANRHAFVVCTKRPEIARDFFASITPMQASAAALRAIGTRFLRMCNGTGTGEWSGCRNIILMTSAENQSAAADRIPLLLECPLPNLAVSAEPLLGELDLSAWIDRLCWVVAGAESGPRRRPAMREWFIRLIAQCRLANVPLFIKQMDFNGRLHKLPDFAGRFWDGFPSL
jgi:protein gp37